MMAVSHIDNLLASARKCYAQAAAWERKNPGKRSFQFGFAADMLMRIVHENEVAMSREAWDKFEGLMEGDKRDVRQAFAHLGAYARIGRENAIYHLKHSRRR